ncbi:MAG: endolytic transglycosylase MltG, partial [Candidatus Hydrogenedentota bacterium]
MASDAEKRPRRARLALFMGAMLWLSAVLAVLAAAAGFGAFLIYDHITQPGVMGTPVDVIIPEGATGKGIGNLLTALGLVEHEILFRAAIRLDGTSRPIKHGQYTLHRGQSPTEILQRLYEGPNKAFDPSTLPPDQIVTVPEGLTIAQAAEMFDDPGAFEASAADPAYLDRLGLETPTLEGFLMPNSFYF